MRTAVTLRCQPCLKVARESRQVSSPCSVAFLQGARPERLGPDVPAATQTPSPPLARGLSRKTARNFHALCTASHVRERSRTSLATRRHIRHSRRRPCSAGSTVVFEAATYLKSDRMLWLFWLAIDSACTPSCCWTWRACRR